MSLSFEDKCETSLNLTGIVILYFSAPSGSRISKFLKSRKSTGESPELNSEDMMSLI